MEYLNQEEKIGFDWLSFCFLKLVVICWLFVLLAFFVLRFFGFVVYDVQTNSMLPSFDSFDCVLVKSKSEIEVGEVICFDSPLFGNVTHRVLDIRIIEGQKVFFCCGDNNLAKRGFGSWREARWELETLDFEGAKSFADNLVNEKDVDGKVVLIFKNGQIIFNFFRFFAIFCGIFLIFLIIFKNNTKKQYFKF